jgi:hypothetical protein
LTSGLILCATSEAVWFRYSVSLRPCEGVLVLRVDGGERGRRVWLPASAERDETPIVRLDGPSG